MNATYDLFLSYRWANKAAVEPLVAALQLRGIRVWQDDREVEDLASIQQAVVNGLARTRALLAWYSVQYNESRACQWELTSAYTAAQAEGDPRRRILVVNPEKGNAHIHLPELFDQLHLSGAAVPNDAAAVQALADRIQAALKRVPTTELGTLQSLTPPLWLPAMGTGSNRFVGRLREMWQVHGALQAGQAAMLTGTGGKAGVALVSGAGGIGKSLMAEEYALRFGAAYPGGVFWLRAFGYPDGGRELDATQRSNERDAQELDIAMRLGIVTANLSAAQVRGALMSHFALRGQRYLWVVDDLPPDPGPGGLAGWLAPHPLGCSLFTTRTRRFRAVTTVELPQLEPDDARRLLIRKQSVSTADVQIADDICKLLGYHALAIDVTAALVDRRGLEAVREALQHPSSDALALAAQFEEALPNGHQRQIAATFLASIEQLDETARELLRISAVLAVAPIPPRLLRDVVVAAGETDKGAAQDRVDLAISQLLSANLADDAGDHAINVHALVSRTIRITESSPQPWTALRACLVGVLAAEMVRAADIREHATLEPWVTHARELSESPENAPTAGLLGWVARFDLERASHLRAMRGFARELEVNERLLGEEHPDTLNAMHNVAATLRAQGDLRGARAVQERVLEVTRRVRGGEHLDTLAAMSNLAVFLGEQGDRSDARQLQEAVLEVRKRVQGEQHPDTLISMNNLAETLWAQGDLSGAKELEEAVLEVRKKVLGEEHPNTLISMNNLAETLRAQGDLAGAERLHAVVLEARRRVLGDEHLDTLKSMSNVAESLRAREDLPGARSLQEVVLEARRRVLGEEHPDTLRSMNNLAETLRVQGELPRARLLQEEAAEGMQRLLGEAHPITLAMMNNLALSRAAQGG